ncbi:hypothetical protein SARC_07385 [Sphaeroforma arctica JP610]|uniref:Uncharacterized protein n=1 Tax=Sphaeroforma arctica JP610 TaxID=667725 RepID=A0A0L0FTU8_9EUKA|nr:hypothetical protein SARC_07385 [Sphaeroforma arctica JP610]KNC80247.1 hypothetical protein SARC_07385 [Sphaeroforma arctica JP610]|eukprot:XP_014154149.1 hypothetical protein SARC_07385 [Sphaeroforma arctica JP610]
MSVLNIEGKYPQKDSAIDWDPIVPLYRRVRSGQLDGRAYSQVPVLEKRTHAITLNILESYFSQLCQRAGSDFLEAYAFKFQAVLPPATAGAKIKATKSANCAEEFKPMNSNR